MFEILQIIEKLEMSDDPLHIVGLSMGGAIAGLYAAEYPQVVDRVTMMCPASRFLGYFVLLINE